MIALYFFYFFAFTAILSAFFVIFANNPVHSVLFLILVFCNSAVLLILLEAEFLALIFIVVYVGAIAVLFLFVVMMLNVKITEIQDEVLQYLPIGGLIGIVFLLEIFLIIEGDFVSLINPNQDNTVYIDWFAQIDSISNIQTLGNVLYTDYVLFFLLAGVILLIAMVGAIVLTMSTRSSLRRQFIYQQVSRDFDNAVFLVTHKN